MDKKYCILDMDGTLVDSMPYWDSLSPDYLRAKGITEDVSELMEHIKAMTMPEACLVLKKRFGLEESPEQIQEQLGEAMRAHYSADIPLKEGAGEYLDSLRAAGARLCVVSSTAPALVKLCLQRLGVWDMFEFVISCEEVGGGKDRPDAYLEAARRFMADPGQIAVFEDARTPVETAKGAGFHTVAVFDPYTRNWEDCERIADEVILDWRQAEPDLSRSCGA